MVKDKYAKALDFMVKMNFTDICKGYDAKGKKCNCLKEFVGDEICQEEAKNFFGNISFDLWKDIGEDEDEEAVKEKVIDFLNPFHVAINQKEIFFNFK